MSVDFADKLAELRRVYVASLPLKLDEIFAAMTRRAFGDTRSLAHRLRGTAGSYGLPAISAAAGAIEDRMDTGEEHAIWSELEELLAAARLAVKELS